MSYIQGFFALLIIVFAALSVFYSIRYRRQTDERKRGLYSARLNISMGFMLIIIAITQLFFFTDSNTRRIFGTTCLLIGLFNLFVGLRNHSSYSKVNKQG
jgi:hypothetical protein